jgi:hypothetical protein
MDSKYTIAILIVIILVLLYYVYKCNFPSVEQRIWPGFKPFSDKEFMILMADADINMKEDPLFIAGKTLSKDVSMYNTPEERNSVKKDAIAFFKKQFGLSSAYINTAILELRVNPKSKYHAREIKGQPGEKLTLQDGGFIVYLPANKTLYGDYGGKNGVSQSMPGILTYGHYIFGKYKIRYTSACPLFTYRAYDANYSPVDCNVLIEDSPHKEHIGLRGKARGIMMNYKIRGGLNHISIRNTITI